MKTSQHIATVDPSGMRARNRGLLLRLIWSERAISRAEIARNTGLSPSTVSAIVADLQQRGLVRTQGTGTSRGGRRPVMLGFCDDAFAIVGVEIGASHVSLVLTDLRGKVIARAVEAQTTRDDPQGTLLLVKRLALRVLAKARISTSRVVGMGVGVPSPVSPDAPGKLSPLILPAWREINVVEALRDTLDVPVRIDNDANLGALAERMFGAGRGGGDLAYIKLGTGIGAGHIIRGELYRGAGGTAGEIGHLALDPSGPLCICGLRGCLTTFIGTDALLRRAAATFPISASTLTVRDLVSTARSGLPAALDLVEELGHHLGIALAGLLNMMNPAVVVLGGEVSELGDLLLDPVRACIRSRALFTSVAATRIVTTELGQDAIAVGAAALVLEDALRDHTLFPSLLAEGVA